MFVLRFDRELLRDAVAASLDQVTEGHCRDTTAHELGVTMPELLNPTPAEIEAAFAAGCPECLEIGSAWVHLRICLECGHVGCCDNSPQTHATKHWESSGHAVIQSLEPGETWRWNYATQQDVS